ncbi:uncharacterized protein DNG_04282 [Cephalotrichum gorgonifer]|uniref:Uncharacterized protein n=1 Tax=Cephalotrichum gorgonifer TaxID=2041049 RepID=A0AAE8MWH9_9PEZI|nr:uncharacterized protein DNG_04282 [Cephalotrichum gorgonifer]
MLKAAQPLMGRGMESGLKALRGEANRHTGSTLIGSGVKYSSGSVLVQAPTPNFIQMLVVLTVRRTLLAHLFRARDKLAIDSLATLAALGNSSSGRDSQK